MGDMQTNQEHGNGALPRPSALGSEWPHCSMHCRQLLLHLSNQTEGKPQGTHSLSPPQNQALSLGQPQKALLQQEHCGQQQCQHQGADTWWRRRSCPASGC